MCLETTVFVLSPRFIKLKYADFINKVQLMMTAVSCLTVTKCLCRLSPLKNNADVHPVFHLADCVKQRMLREWTEQVSNGAYFLF